MHWTRIYPKMKTRSQKFESRNSRTRVCPPRLWVDSLCKWHNWSCNSRTNIIECLWAWDAGGGGGGAGGGASFGVHLVGSSRLASGDADAAVWGGGACVTWVAARGTQCGAAGCARRRDAARHGGRGEGWQLAPGRCGPAAWTQSGTAGEWNCWNRNTRCRESSREGAIAGRDEIRRGEKRERESEVLWLRSHTPSYARRGWMGERNWSAVGSRNNWNPLSVTQIQIGSVVQRRRSARH